MHDPPQPSLMGASSFLPFAFVIDQVSARYKIVLSTVDSYNNLKGSPSPALNMIQSTTTAKIKGDSTQPFLTPHTILNESPPTSLHTSPPQISRRNDCPHKS